jgi:hypothetical protein
MSNELSPQRGNVPTNWVSRAPRPTASRLTPTGRAMVRSDKHTEIEAREDYNAARLMMHRTQLRTVIEKAEAQSRAELTQDALLHSQAVDTLVTALSAGKPALELILRGIQEAHSIGEQQRIIRRGLGL